MEDPSDLKEGITLSYLGLNSVHNWSHGLKMHILRLCKPANRNLWDVIFREQLIQHFTTIHILFQFWAHGEKSRWTGSWLFVVWEVNLNLGQDVVRQIFQVKYFNTMTEETKRNKTSLPGNTLWRLKRALLLREGVGVAQVLALLDAAVIAMAVGVLEAQAHLWTIFLQVE